jgi:DivIVA domain-containing protein
MVLLSGRAGPSWHDHVVPLLLVLVLLGVLAAVAVLAAGRGGSMADAPRDRAPGAALPDSAVSADDIDHLRFSLAFRGYRMDEVDATLDRLAAELAERNARIAELEGGGPERLADPRDHARLRDDAPDRPAEGA